MMRLKSFIVLCLIALCSVTQAKEFTYKSVKGDPMATRIYFGQRSDGVSVVKS